MSFALPRNTLALACLLAAGAAHPVLADSTAPWSGCYAGARMGHAQADIDGTVLADDINVAQDTYVGSANADGGAFGIQLGCDRQTGNWVVGARLAVDFTDASGGHQYIDGTTPTNRMEHDIKHVGSLSGRIGHLFQPDTLGYVKAGIAWAKTRHTDADPGWSPPYTGSSNIAHDGWVFGVGLEHRIQKNMSLFVEYEHMDFGKKHTTIHYTGGDDYSFSFDQDMSLLSLGFNLHFN